MVIYEKNINSIELENIFNLIKEQKDEDKFLMKEVDNAFNFIPDETNDNVIYTKDTTPIFIGVKPVKATEEKA